MPSVKSCCVPLFLSFTLKKCCIHLKFIFELSVLLLSSLLLLLSLMNSLGCCCFFCFFYHDCLSHRAHFVLHGYLTEIPRGSGSEVALPSVATVGKHCIVLFRPRFLSFLYYYNYFIYLFWLYNSYMVHLLWMDFSYFPVQLSYIGVIL